MRTARLRVKDWRKFQHYGSKPTPPPWIKLHVALLDDADFWKLSQAQRYQLIAIWLLASRDQGRIPFDSAFVAKRIGARRVDLEAFLESGWLQLAERDGLVDPDEDISF